MVNDQTVSSILCNSQRQYIRHYHQFIASIGRNVNVLDPLGDVCNIQLLSLQVEGSLGAIVLSTWHAWLSIFNLYPEARVEAVPDSDNTTK